MNIYVASKESTLPALVAAKQLVMNASYPEVEVHKFIAHSRCVIITLAADDKGNITESWKFEDTSGRGAPVVITSDS